MQYYDDRAAADLALQSGRADVEFNPNATQAYSRSHQGHDQARRHRLRRLAADGRNRRDDEQGRRPCRCASPSPLNDLIKNGKYGEVLKRWSLNAEAIDEAQDQPAGPAEERLLKDRSDGPARRPRRSALRVRIFWRVLS